MGPKIPARKQTKQIKRVRVWKVSPEGIMSFVRFSVALQPSDWVDFSGEFFITQIRLVDRLRHSGRWTFLQNWGDHNWPQVVHGRMSLHSFHLKCVGRVFVLLFVCDNLHTFLLSHASSQKIMGIVWGRIDDENIILVAKMKAMALAAFTRKLFLRSDSYANKWIYRRQNGHLQFYRKSNLRRQKVQSIEIAHTPNNASIYFSVSGMEHCHSKRKKKKIKIVRKCAILVVVGWLRVYAIRSSHTVYVALSIHIKNSR